MAPVRNARVLFNSIPAPNTYPEPGKTTRYDDSQTIDPDNVPLNGGFLVKILVLSIDPYMRGRMRDPKIESYTVSALPSLHVCISVTHILPLASVYLGRAVSASTAYVCPADRMLAASPTSAWASSSAPNTPPSSQATTSTAYSPSRSTR